MPLNSAAEAVNTMNEYFVWNLPLFASKETLERRLYQTLGEVKVDFWRPRKSTHKDHGGCARIQTLEEVSCGELFIGFRYPVYLKEWVVNQRHVPVIKSSKKWSWEIFSNDTVSEEKSSESAFSVSICTAYNIVENMVVNCDSIDIFPNQSEANIGENSAIDMHEQEFKIDNVVCAETIIEETSKDTVLVEFLYDALRSSKTGFVNKMLEEKSWRCQAICLLIKHHIGIDPLIWFEEKKQIAVSFNMQDLKADIKDFRKEFEVT